ncbi:MAG: phospholipase D-like domain-containing protein [Gemmatimonadales bacterium]
MELAFDRAAGARTIEGNQVRLLIDGPGAYRAMLDAIAAARRTVHFENYIIRDDDTGRRFAEALKARARDGLEVRVTYDWFGSIGTGSRFWRDLRSAGIQVRAFNTPKLFAAFANLSRDHRKLVVTDGRRAITGGLCIGDEWVGNPTKGVQPWRDTAIEIVGPAAASMDETFATTWHDASGLPDTSDHDSGRHLISDAAEGEAERGDASLRVIAGKPGRERAYKVLEMLATSCAERLWITDAYMVPPPRLFQAFIDAARDGVDIRLLVPGSSDVGLVRNLTRIGYRDLLRAGVRIFEWLGPMLHAKTIVADSRWSRVGTSNLNASSLLGNYELDVIVDEEEFARELEDQFRRDVARSSEIVRNRRTSQRFDRVLPSRLARQVPEQTPDGHRRTGREARRHAVVVMWTVVVGARRSIFGPLALILIALSGFFLGFPRVTAYLFGAICIWLGVAAARESLRRRGLD